MEFLLPDSGLEPPLKLFSHLKTTIEVENLKKYEEIPVFIFKKSDLSIEIQTLNPVWVPSHNLEAPSEVENS